MSIMSPVSDPSTAPDAAQAHPALPFLYTALQPLSPERHGDLRLRMARDYSFAAAQQAVPLTLDEFPAALRDYPIVFADGPVPTPVALLGLQAGENPCVQPNGTWASDRYVPRYIQQWPFLMLDEAPGSERSVLCIDPTSAALNTSDGEALFAENEPTETLREMQEAARIFDAATKRTRAICEEIQDMGLLKSSTIRFDRSEERIGARGFLMVSDERLRALPDATLADLARRGLLALITAHHLSLSRFSTI